VGVILGTSERPFAEAGKRAGHSRDADVPEDFPSFDSLPAQASSIPETAF
jgi:hypothetical protein